VVILSRKFLIAFTSLMVRSFATYQLALALLVMFAAFVLQVVHRPYITPLNKKVCDCVSSLCCAMQTSTVLYRRYSSAMTSLR
jgi:hypothetical protein